MCLYITRRNNKIVVYVIHGFFVDFIQAIYIKYIIGVKSALWPIDVGPLLIFFYIFMECCDNTNISHKYGAIQKGRIIQFNGLVGPHISRLAPHKMTTRRPATNRANYVCFVNRISFVYANCMV